MPGGNVSVVFLGRANNGLRKHEQKKEKQTAALRISHATSTVRSKIDADTTYESSEKWLSQGLHVVYNGVVRMLTLECSASKGDASTRRGYYYFHVENGPEVNYVETVPDLWMPYVYYIHWHQKTKHDKNRRKNCEAVAALITHRPQLRTHPTNCRSVTTRKLEGKPCSTLEVQQPIEKGSDPGYNTSTFLKQVDRTTRQSSLFTLHHIPSRPERRQHYEIVDHMCIPGKKSRKHESTQHIYIGILRTFALAITFEVAGARGFNIIAIRATMPVTLAEARYRSAMKRFDRKKYLPGGNNTFQFSPEECRSISSLYNSSTGSSARLYPAQHRQRLPVRSKQQLPNSPSHQEQECGIEPTTAMSVRLDSDGIDMSSFDPNTSHTSASSLGSIHSLSQASFATNWDEAYWNDPDKPWYPTTDMADMIKAQASSNPDGLQASTSATAAANALAVSVIDPEAQLSGNHPGATLKERIRRPFRAVRTFVREHPKIQKTLVVSGYLLKCLIYLSLMFFVALSVLFFLLFIPSMLKVRSFAKDQLSYRSIPLWGLNFDITQLQMRKKAVYVLLEEIK
ncbi:hypothetical protein BJ508DRAFT_314646 [Ascobolus immersus RN42]|uniref:Uncharacterized protein n=1 Tax=Ascobolus immersus RN42 TaxID=1160509 RepID=A0A3N4HKY5_ASCIM|nr:hypothetical protein BJ508DRAFT_314646 [Ascobolus immersus RN42]